MDSEAKIFPIHKHPVMCGVRDEVRLRARKALGAFISYLMRVYNLL
jgi:hypothetical protein